MLFFSLGGSPKLYTDVLRSEFETVRSCILGHRSFKWDTVLLHKSIGEDIIARPVWDKTSAGIPDPRQAGDPDISEENRGERLFP